MQITPPSVDAPKEEWIAYATAVSSPVNIHKCIDEGRQENTLGREANAIGFRRITIGGNISIAALLSLCVTVGGGLIAGVRWTDKVDNDIHEVLQKLDNHDRVLKQLNDQVRPLVPIIAHNTIEINRLERKNHMTREKY